MVEGLSGHQEPLLKPFSGLCQEFKTVWDFHLNPGAVRTRIRQVPLGPALMDETFKEQYRGIINSFLDYSQGLMGNHCRSKLDSLKKELKQTLMNVTEELQLATRTAMRWGYKLFKNKLSVEQYRIFILCWRRSVVCHHHEANSQLVEHSPSQTETWMSVVGDTNITTSPASTDPA